MVFTEPRFFVFFAVVFLLYWGFRRDSARKWLLLAASYVFYSAWDWRFSSLLLISTLLDYTAGLKIGESSDSVVRKRWISVSLIGNLGILGFFKYYNFFVDSAAELLSRLGIAASPPLLHIVLPVGVSFYTFQTLSYALDVYRGTLRPCSSLRDFALFVAFFPQLVAGPIVRATDFLPQLDSIRLWRDVRVRECVGLFLVGYFKKACLADHLAVQVDRVFAAPTEFSTLHNWLGAILYQIQVYCDFSGYSDIAVATAGLLGYGLMRNFDFPYFARDIAEFWRRWHISLSTWLRDYLYISLGGSRVNSLRAIVNVFVTFTLCGLWHGAAWNFVVFGIIHGAYVTIHAAWKQFADSRPSLEPMREVIGIPFTNLFFLLSLVVFRSTSWTHCGEMFRAMFTWTPSGTQTLHPLFFALLGPLFLVHFLAFRGSFARSFSRIQDALAASLFGVGFAVAFFLAATEYKPFVYFQF